MPFSWTRLPFRYRTTEEYQTGVMALISRAFYEVLPAAGFEVREEQAYTSYRIARMMTAGGVFMAEAGSGTGKTFAYLLPAVCHARKEGRPAVVACASNVLQHQLADRDADAHTLSKLLELDMDVRLAGESKDYLCEQKVDALSAGMLHRKGMARLKRWAEGSSTGARSEIPDVPDELWETVSWDESLPCDTCKKRGYCRLVRAREWYRASTDVLVCSHSMFFDDLWSREARKAEGLLPLLPPYSGVVFDEGHKVPDAARDTAGKEVSRIVLERALRLLELAVGDNKDIIPQVIFAIQRAERLIAPFFRCLARASRESSTERWHVEGTPELIDSAARLLKHLEALQDAIALAEDVVDDERKERFYVLQFRLDAATEALHRIVAADRDAVTAMWASRPDSEEAVLWAVPRRADRMIQRELLRQNLPVVLTSATLSSAGSFDYIKRMIGAPDAGSSSAGTPFDFATQAIIYSPGEPPSDVVNAITAVIDATRGRALVLLNTQEEVRRLKEAFGPNRFPWSVFFEGDADRMELLRRFRADKHSILVGSSFWEGVDVPGESLSCVVIPRLPFPADDPLLAVRRQEASKDRMDPFEAVDVPEMVLKLKQGCGRLIRAATDRGVLALLDLSFRDTAYADAVGTALPEEAERTTSLARLAEFLGG